MKNASLYSFALTACVLIAVIGVIAAAPATQEQTDLAIPTVNVSLEDDGEVVSADEMVLRDWEFTRSRGDRCSTGRPG